MYLEYNGTVVKVVNTRHLKCLGWQRPSRFKSGSCYSKIAIKMMTEKEYNELAIKLLENYVIVTADSKEYDIARIVTELDENSGEWRLNIHLKN